MMNRQVTPQKVVTEICSLLSTSTQFYFPLIYLVQCMSIMGYSERYISV